MSVLSEALVKVTVDQPLGAAESSSFSVGRFSAPGGLELHGGKKDAGAFLFQQVDSLKHLLEAGASVNAPPDPCEQSPVHLAAGGGRACFLLWQLQTGADLNQQDVFGEAPIHKAAKVGSLECLSLLVASDAQIDLCNKNGQTAEDLAWSYGFPECAKFLTAVKCMQTKKPSEPSGRGHGLPALRLRRSFGSAENTGGKRKCW